MLSKDGIEPSCVAKASITTCGIKEYASLVQMAFTVQIEEQQTITLLVQQDIGADR
jgi:hypothetical protein